MDYYDSESIKETPAPLPKDYQNFEKNYKINLKDILITEEYKLYEGESINEKTKVIIKEYKDEYIKKLFLLII